MAFNRRFELSRFFGPVIITVLLTSGSAFLYASPTVAAQGNTNVSVQNFAFSPNSIKVVIGVNNTIAWTNHDSVNHTVTADDGSFDTNLAPGSTFTHTFTGPGTYTYHCKIHPYMQGTVIVLGSASTSSQSSNTQGSTSSSGGIPEFPLQGATVAIVTLVVLASYLVMRQTKKV